MTRGACGLIAGFLFAVLAPLACGSSSSTTDDDAGRGPLPDGGPSPDDAHSFADTKEEPNDCRVCSDDLHRVLDCKGATIETCGSGLGCADGACVPACDAAEKSQRSIGCDFYSVPPMANSFGSCFAAFVTNVWDIPLSLTVDRKGVTYDGADIAYLPSGKGGSMTYTPIPDGQIPPGQVAIVFLSSESGSLTPCPEGVNPAVSTNPALIGGGIANGNAFHIHTSAPVTANDIFPYGGGASAVSSANLLLPTSVWGTNYVGIDAYSANPSSGGLAPWLVILAREDDTEVTLSPTADIAIGDGYPASKKGVPRTFTLNQGQYLQLAQEAELVGTPIESTKPVGVWGGEDELYVITGAFDADHKQLSPVSALGHEYVAARYRDRFDDIPESPPWRIVGAVDGTILTYSNQPDGAPDTIDKGEMVEFRSEGDFVVSSQDDQHPFYFIGYMTGCAVYGTDTDCRGDPEFLPMVPPQEYLNSYTFFTDPTYPETDLVLVRKKVGGATVNLDCAGAVSGWYAVGDYEVAHVDLVRHDFEPQGACDNGVHRMWSDAPFGLTVWGWGSAETGTGANFSQAVSYAYPGGMSIRPINSVVVKPLPQ